jgi:hypothetical protein
MVIKAGSIVVIRERRSDTGGGSRNRRIQGGQRCSLYRFAWFWYVDLT